MPFHRERRRFVETFRARSPFPPTSIRHTQPEAEAHAAKGEVTADLPDAEEESLALVDAKVLEEEQKLREERKKAEEASKTEVRQLARSPRRRAGNRASSAGEGWDTHLDVDLSHGRGGCVS